MTDLDLPSPSSPAKPAPGMFRLTVRIDFDDGTSVAQSTDLTKTILSARDSLFDLSIPAAHASCSAQNVIGQATLKLNGL